MQKLIICLLGYVLIFAACGNGGSTASMPLLNLMDHGMPIKIKAPDGAKVEAQDLGIMKDVTVKGEGNFFLQITSGELRSNDVAKKKSELLSEVKATPFFSEVVEEFENGFIYKKKISEERINYDFRSFKFQGSNEYLFQTGLLGQFTLDEVKNMYNSVQ